ncbi:MAG: CHASE domain-containing protein [Magnetospirillum sp.]|nr:CHASE domain-containing protein [Magnetospirillum sp.]
MVLVVGLLLTVAGWLATRQWVASEAGAVQERRVEELNGLVRQRVSLYEQALNATAAFIRIAQPARIRDWEAFVDRLGIATNYPGIAALAYAPVIHRTDAELFVAEARADGLPDFRLWPSADPEVMVPNRFTAPLNADNRRALGYDMYQDPLRRAAMDAARDSGTTAITAKILLKIDADEGGEAAFIAYAPVYAQGAVLDTVEQRRAALQGFTLAPIRVPSLVSFVAEQVAPDAVVRIYEGSNPQQGGLLHVSPGYQSVERWWRRDIRFFDRPWTMFYGFRPQAGRLQDRALPWVVLVLGGAVSILLAGMVRSLVNARGYALALAADMTRALSESEARFKAVFDNSVQFESLLTRGGRLISANPSALALVGGELATVEGLPFWEVGWLDVEAERRRCREALERAAKGEWVRLDVLRHDGEAEMRVDVSFKPVFNDAGEVAWIVAEGRDLTERLRREDALNRAVDALTRSNQELERFAHIAAHDLQEPCRTIISYAQLLERRAVDRLDRDERDFLAYMIGGAHRMRDLVADLLAYSRVEAKAAPFEAVDCAGVVAGVLADLQRTVAEAGAHIEVGELPVVLGDGPQLAQLFQNLVGNALKFRAADRVPEIRISAMREPTRWHFVVADNGIGIAPAYHRRVFEIFQRLHGPDRYPGTGIGLAICRKVVERHGGRIWVDSEDGRGSRFHFVIPLAG